MDASMPTVFVATAVRIVPTNAKRRLNQMANNVAVACASVAAALREVFDDRFWE